MRNTVIMRAFCSECGKVLDIPYEARDGVKLEDIYQNGDKTGATVRYLELIVEPCGNCISKHTRPAKQLAKAITEMMSEHE